MLSRQALEVSLRRVSKFLVVTDHDTLRHLLKQPNDKLNKRLARYLRDLQPFVGSTTNALREL
jgi:C4-dicarboxylate-specific signal transduction histidine kinase